VLISNASFRTDGGHSGGREQTAGFDPKLSLASTDIAMPALSGHWPSAKPEATQAV
jgi:hypothetical protein